MHTFPEAVGTRIFREGIPGVVVKVIVRVREQYNYDLVCENFHKIASLLKCGNLWIIAFAKILDLLQKKF